MYPLAWPSESIAPCVQGEFTDEIAFSELPWQYKKSPAAFGVIDGVLIVVPVVPDPAASLKNETVPPVTVKSSAVSIAAWTVPAPVF
jgi:hypothetical protein